MISVRFINALLAPALATFIFFGSGCAQLPPPAEFDELAPAQRESRQKARKLIAQLVFGTSLEQVSELWSDEVPPYRSETRITQHEGDTKIILIEWYYTDLVKNNGKVTQDELTPVVFDREGLLLGWGRIFLDQLHDYLEKQKEQ